MTSPETPATPQTPETPQDITGLLRAWRDGDAAALAALTPLVYGELRRVAAQHMRRERPDHTLQATALVHEAFLRLTGGASPAWEDRAHFFKAAARIMRHVLVDHARARGYAKRGGGGLRISIEDGAAAVLAAERAPDLVALDEALDRLERLDPRQHQVVELRFFGGLSVEETAEALGVSAITVKRDWRSARAWLFAELGGSAP